MNGELAGKHVRNIRRAWAGANLCRHRLEDIRNAAPAVTMTALGPLRDLRGLPTHDVDYYAWEAVRIIKIAEKTTAAGLRGKDDVEKALVALRTAAPGLEGFRNAVAHVEDNRNADDVVYFGEAVRLRPDGSVDYVVDPRYEHHDLLGRLVEATLAALFTLAVPDDGPMPRLDNSGSAE